MMNLYNTSSHSYCFPYYYLETLLISRKQQTMSKMCLRVLSESVLILNSAGPHEKHFRQTDESRPAVNNNTSQKQREWKVVRTLARVQTNGTSLLILLLPKGMQPGLFKALTLRRHDTVPSLSFRRMQTWEFWGGKQNRKQIGNRCSQAVGFVWIFAGKQKPLWTISSGIKLQRSFCGITHSCKFSSHAPCFRIQSSGFHYGTSCGKTDFKGALKGAMRESKFPLILWSKKSLVIS